VIERVFTLPGVGSMLVTDVGNRDLVKVQGEVFLVVAAVLVIGFLTDVAHRLIDPRLGMTG
jgi:peptide/nickel transport system permease protein